MVTLLITGASKRLGAEMVRFFHQKGFNIVFSYLSSEKEANQLAKSLNGLRDHSCMALQCDLNNLKEVQHLANKAQAFGDLKVLINNASSFYPTRLGQIQESDWDELFNSNLKAPLFLSQACFESLSSNSGSIVNMADIHAIRPLKHHTVYSMAKAGLAMLTQSLALEMAPDVRVNAIAPGAILWPENHTGDAGHIPLQETGDPNNIASAAYYLAMENSYITGQILPVDGGRTLLQ